MNRIVQLVFLAACLAACESVAVAEPSMEHGREKTNRTLVSVDMSASPIKDLRTISAAPCCGFHDDGAEYPRSDAPSLFVSNRMETAKAFAQAGVKIVRPQYALIRWQGERATRRHFYERYRNFDWGRAAIDRTLSPNWPWIPQERVFSFWKEQGIKAILCIQGSVYDEVADKMTGETVKVKKVVLDYLKWIVANGYRDVVAGIELENEPFFGSDPNEYARKWAEILPEIRKVLPKVSIGLPIAVYSDNNPDLECVRQRMLATGAIEAENKHTAAHTDQWTGNAIVSLGGACRFISHVIIHVYGADTYYDANIKCVERVRTMQKAFPQIAGKRIWITEWRDRAEEDMRSQKKFRTTLWKAHFLLTMLAQPDVDATCQLGLIDESGALYLSKRGVWSYDDRAFRDWGFCGSSRLDVGGCGALYRLFTNALQDHPRVMTHGATNGFKTMNVFYDSLIQHWKNADEPIRGGVEWIAALNAKGDNVALLAVNSSDMAEKVSFSVADHELRRSVVRLLSCDGKMIDRYEVPGEPKPWKISACESNGCSFSIPANTILVVEVAVKKK